jgi:hypothetical protein
MRSRSSLARLAPRGRGGGIQETLDRSLLTATEARQMPRARTRKNSSADFADSTD